MKVHFSFLEVLYLIVAITSYSFFYHTNGLGFMQGDDFNYVTQLESSGNDDDFFAILTGILALFFFMISLFVKRKYYVLGIALFCINFSFLLIQMGDYFVTIIHGNIVLFFLLLTVMVMNFLLIKRIYEKIK
ncbi:hypothetical protein N5J53_12120 [Empedobacter sp. GD03644]|uniref:hypothetical protein n=2 Tax=Empedobacter TaxID=59734 RepID=UPI00244C6E17|nr:MULTISPECIES: hypothetical protein [unclassified Empedobacter]MDH2207746.1 hypothetical protein [Empedobacter sp. GD03644]